MKKIQAYYIILVIALLFVSVGFAYGGNAEQRNSSLFPRITERNRWYYEALFGVQVDQHVSPRLPAPGLNASEEQIVAMIRRVNPDFIQMHAKGRPGFTTYFTKLPELTVVPGLRADLFRAYRNAAYSTGKRFIAYTRGVSDELAARRHPEWTRVDIDGNRHVWFLCHNGDYVERHHLPHLRELLVEYDVDGFFFDGDVWTVRECFCDTCRKMFTEEYSLPVPESRDDPLWHTYAEFQRKTYDRYSRRAADFVHEIKPGAMYGINTAYVQIHPEPVPDYIDFISLDIGGYRRADMVSEVAHYLDAEPVPWEIVIGDVLWSRSREKRIASPKSQDYINMEHAITLAHGGRAEVWTIPRPDGALSPHFVDLAEKQAEFIYKRKDVVLYTGPVREVAVLHSAETFYREGGGYFSWYGVLDRINGVHQALVEHHIPFHTLNTDYFIENLFSYKAAVLSHQTVLNEETMNILRRWVDAGGKLLVTGLTASQRDGTGGIQCAIGDLLGVSFLPAEKIVNGFIPWRGWALSTYADFYPVKPAAARTEIRLADEWRPDGWEHWRSFPLNEYFTNQPELKGTRREIQEIERDWRTIGPDSLPYPAMTVNRFGRGTVVYIPADIFGAYLHAQVPGVGEFIQRAVDIIYDEPAVTTDAPKTLQVALRQKGTDLIVHLVNTAVDGDMDTEGAAFPESAVPTGGFTVKVKSESRPGSVTTVPNDFIPHWQYENKYIHIAVPTVRIHTALVIHGILKN